MKTSVLSFAILAVSVSLSGLAYAAPISSESDPALATAALVDFESGPTGNWVTQPFGVLTVTALNSSYSPAATFSVGSDYAGEYNTRGSLHITNHGNEFQALRLDFNSPASAFGFLFGASDSSWNLNAYNAGGTLLESMVIAPVFGSNAGDFFGFSGLSSATYATLIQNQDGVYASGGVDYVFVDNVRVSAVPEPETYAMLLAGLGLLGAVARRCKA